MSYAICVFQKFSGDSARGFFSPAQDLVMFLFTYITVALCCWCCEVEYTDCRRLAPVVSRRAVRRGTVRSEKLGTTAGTIEADTGRRRRRYHLQCLILMLVYGLPDKL